MFSFLKRDKDDAQSGASSGAAWRTRLRGGLAATRARLGAQLYSLLSGARRVDEALFEELENVLLACDVGVDATRYLLQQTRARIERGRLEHGSEVRDALKSALLALLAPLERPLEISRARPFVILMAGVNGAGKTTSTGKLAKRMLDQDRTVLLAAGDTFRAAAREQLEAWGARNGVTVVAQRDGDSAAVIFDAIQSARAKDIDVVIADTAGRLPTQLHLMEELKKVKRVIARALPGAPHEVLLVLDANTGQNAVAQVKAFDEALGVTGLILTKLDGTAKGGAIAAVARYKPIPLRFVGVGEGADDLYQFDAQAFVDALFE